MKTIFLTRKKNFPKRFLYVGRYYDFKGVKTLWDAFIQLQVENPNDWELWCLGNGDLEPLEHPKIKHLGFMQPEDLDKIISETGIFILPSLFEPWGVVVQEYAAAGYPLILSNQIGYYFQYQKTIYYLPVYCYSLMIYRY